MRLVRERARGPKRQFQKALTLGGRSKSTKGMDKKCFLKLEKYNQLHVIKGKSLMLLN